MELTTKRHLYRLGWGTLEEGKRPLPGGREPEEFLAELVAAEAVVREAMLAELAAGLEPEPEKPKRKRKRKASE